MPPRFFAHLHIFRPILLRLNYTLLGVFQTPLFIKKPNGKTARLILSTLRYTPRRTSLKILRYKIGKFVFARRNGNGNNEIVGFGNFV